MPRPMAVIGITFFFTTALLCGVGVKAVPVCVCAAAAGFVFCMLLRGVRQSAVLPAACIAVAAAGLFFAFSFLYGYLPAVELSGENVPVSGRLADIPYKVDEKYRYILKCDSIGENETDGLKLILSSKNRLDAEPYDIISFTGTVYPAGGSSADSQSYYRSQSVYLGGYTKNGITVTKTSDKPPMYYVFVLRQKILNSINETLPKEEGGVVAAMLTGYRTYLPQKILDDFSGSGVLHLFSVSGLHMTLWALSVYGLLERLKINRRLAAALTMLFTLFFIALTGFSASCMRAGIMMLVILAGKLISRDADSINSLGLAVLIICIINPFSAGYVGLLLSFLSTFGLILLAPVIYRSLTDRLRMRSAVIRKPLSAFAASASVSFSAMVFSAPVMISSFPQFPLISPVTNLLAMLPASVCMLFGGISAVPAGVRPLVFLSKASALVSGLCAKLLIFITRICSSVPFAQVGAGEKYIRLWLALSMLLVAAAILLSKLDRRIMRTTAVLCAVTLLTGVVSFGLLNFSLAEITVTDTGGGSAVLVSKEGSAALFGCGGDYFASDAIIETLRETGADGLDFLLLPRAEETEASAAEALLNLTDARFIAVPERSDGFASIDFKNDVSYCKRFSYGIWQGFNAEYYYSETSCAAYLDIDNTTVLVIFYPGCDVSELPQKWLGADILVCRAVPPAGIDASRFGMTVISSSGDKSERATEKINLNGGRAYTTSRGNVTVRTRGDSVCSVNAAQPLRAALS